MNDYLKNIIYNLPESPGCYQYLNEKEVIIYVGKAKNLKRRVNSYFNKEQQTYKTKLLVKHIREIKYIVVNSEEDALLLENNLIKKYKPHYNVLLKDDKTYPSLCIKNEHFPRIIKTRHIVKDGSRYYGPYSHVQTMYTLLELIKNMYQLRTCKLNLSPEKIKEKKYKPCLEYHMHNCKAPCIGLQEEIEYQRDIEEIKNILNGKIKEIAKEIYDKMLKCSTELKYEEAEILKKRYLEVENYRAKSEVVSNSINNIDVFTLEEYNNSSVFINYLHITKGAINQAFTFEYKKRLDETKEELLELGIIEMREKYKSESKEIIIPFPIATELNEVTLTIPQKGDKKKLLDLSLMNVKQYKLDRLKQSMKLNSGQRNVQLMKEIQDTLHLKQIPINIECFDNSNIQGTDAVSVCVVFKELKPSKKDYRKYIIKTVTGPNDYASMQEVVHRRYKRIKEEGGKFPDLIIMDGGILQMNATRKILEQELKITIPIAGLVKNMKHKTSEILIGFPPQTIGIKQTSALFHLLEQIQNEVHRFAINFHRDKRSKHQIESELDTIKGIGDKTKEILLKKYKSVKRIKEIEKEELEGVIGKSKATIIKKNLK